MLLCWLSFLLLCWVSYFDVMLSVVMPSVLFVECRVFICYTECRYAECRCSEFEVCWVSRTVLLVSPCWMSLGWLSLYSLSCVLSVTYFIVMLASECHYAEYRYLYYHACWVSRILLLCWRLNVIRQNVAVLSATMLNDVAPKKLVNKTRISGKLFCFLSE